jgi:hypothetical protein
LYHLRDVTFQHLIIELESLLDPEAHDPWPRHHQHFGANLAVTVGAYLQAGGIPRVQTLEDMALFEALRRCDARVRHSPRVRAQTSARRGGRVAIGLSTQLGEWTAAVGRNEIPLVESAATAEARIRQRRRWREFWHGARPDPPVNDARHDWWERRRRHATFGAFYDATQSGPPSHALEPVTSAIAALRLLLAELRALPPVPVLSASREEIEAIPRRAHAGDVLQGQAVTLIEERGVGLVAR